MLQMSVLIAIGIAWQRFAPAHIPALAHRRALTDLVFLYSAACLSTRCHVASSTEHHLRQDFHDSIIRHFHLTILNVGDYQPLKHERPEH